eukprot:2542864-Rhodomonas_salina.1
MSRCPNRKGEGGSRTQPRSRCRFQNRTRGPKLVPRWHEPRPRTSDLCRRMSGLPGSHGPCCPRRNPFDSDTRCNR